MILTSCTELLLALAHQNRDFQLLASRKPDPDGGGSGVHTRIPVVLPETNHSQDLKAQLSQEHDAVRHVMLLKDIDLRTCELGWTGW